MSNNFRSYTLLDRLLTQAETGLRLISKTTVSQRERPHADLPETTASAAERQHTSALMRINHSGEVCAQALYFGQALLARDPAIREQLWHAAQEEIDHLRWCEERIKELGSHTSMLNPVWYGLSVLIGIWASLRGDAYSLGFIHATEAQVEQHLNDHLNQIPEHDHKTRAIIEQMRIDEMTHGAAALDAGGQRFCDKTQANMRKISSIMTQLSYY